MRPSTAITVGILCLPIVYVLVYFGWRGEQDAEGPKQWQATLDHLRARGEPADFKALIPPPVPDADNLAALPLFQVEHDSDTNSPQPLKLRAALKNLNGGDASKFPFPKWGRGERAEPARIALFLALHYRTTFPSQTLPASTLDQFDALCPAINELRQAAATRSQCRFYKGNGPYPPFERPLSGITEMIALAKLTNLHALVALQNGRPEIALDDINLDLKINAGLRQEPILVSGLVAIGCMAIQLGSVWEGLESHAWNDAQLAALQHELASINFLADYQLCLRGEAFGNFAPIMDFTRDHQSTASSILHGMVKEGGDPERSLALGGLGILTPRGWFDSTKARGVELYTDAARACVDPIRRRAYPEQYATIHLRTEKITGTSVPSILLRVAVPPDMGATLNFCVGQFRVDSARIACMLERYRLAHGSFPASLDQLAPYAGPEGVPPDLCNGQPYHYALRPDGTYLLYSVGWNQKDDGGQVEYKPDAPKTTDNLRGDWVWPQPGIPGL